MGNRLPTAFITAELAQVQCENRGICQAGRLQPCQTGHFEHIRYTLTHIGREMMIEIGQIFFAEGAIQRKKRENGRLPAGGVIGSELQPLIQISGCFKVMPRKRFNPKRANHLPGGVRIKANLDLVDQFFDGHGHSSQEC